MYVVYVPLDPYVAGVAACAHSLSSRLLPHPTWRAYSRAAASVLKTCSSLSPSLCSQGSLVPREWSETCSLQSSTRAEWPSL